MSHATRAVAVCTAVAAGLVVVLAAALEPRGFVTGDQGLKLVAAENVLAHPSEPMRVDLPVIDGKPSPYVDRFYRRHGTHAHILQAPLFPMLSAPLLALAGLRGIYVLPAAAFVLLLPLTWAIYSRTAPAPAVTAWAASAVLGSPLFFYAFEFWEHGPAAACLAGSTALALRRASLRTVGGTLAGGLAGLAILLRPEGLWYALALGAVVVWRRAWVPYASGVGVVLVAYTMANYLEAGTLVGDHVATNLSMLSHQWFALRVTRLALWLAPSPAIGAGLLGLAGAWGLRWMGHVEPARLMGLAAALVIAVAAMWWPVPDALWRAWPLGVLALVPLRSSAGLGAVYWLAGSTSLAAWLTSTHDGGAQWGPRFLLISSPALVVSAAAAVRDLVAPGALRIARTALVVGLVALGAWTSRQAYVDLRGWKRYYASLVAAVERHAPPGSYVVTNVWWLDQIAAPIRASRTFLVTTSPAETVDALRLLERHGVRAVSLVWSTEGEAPGRVQTGGSCFSATGEVAIPERRLVLASATCGG